jgi:hypothetical protein
MTILELIDEAKGIYDEYLWCKDPDKRKQLKEQYNELCDTITGIFEEKVLMKI